MTRNNLGQFTRSLWSKITSTIKFTFWFIRFLFTKEGMKQTLWVVGLGLAVAFTLIQFELIGWNQAIDLTSQIFYQESKTIQVSVTHKEQLPVEVMIKKIFGKDANMALAVSHAENGTRQCDRFHVNDNKTVDYGIFMINTVHLKKVAVKDMIDCKKNIEFAYQLFKEQGWTPWTVYQNKSYLKFL